MGQKKKKSVSQKIVGVASTGMPSPVRKLLGLKIVATLIVLAVPTLFAAGILKFEWNEGRPRISVNRERTAEVRENAVERIGEIREARGVEDRSNGFLPGEGPLREQGQQAIEKRLPGIRSPFQR